MGMPHSQVWTWLGGQKVPVDLNLRGYISESLAFRQVHLTATVRLANQAECPSHNLVDSLLCGKLQTLMTQQTFA